MTAEPNQNTQLDIGDVTAFYYLLIHTPQSDYNILQIQSIGKVSGKIFDALIGYLGEGWNTLPPNALAYRLADTPFLKLIALTPKQIANLSKRTRIVAGVSFKGDDFNFFDVIDGLNYQGRSIDREALSQSPTGPYFLQLFDAFTAIKRCPDPAKINAQILAATRELMRHFGGDPDRVEAVLMHAIGQVTRPDFADKFKKLDGMKPL